MADRVLKTLVAAAVCAAAAALVHAQQDGVDIVLTNGKIITVDNRFSIAQAVAIRGDRIVAVGTNPQITSLAGRGTKRIDLKGKAVTPGFIDNHAHIMEEGKIWLQELRLDGVESRREALDLIRAKARTLKPGEWVYTLGGWAIDQFADDKKDFTREELDQASPNNPVLLQFSRCCTYLNSRAIQAAGLDTKTDKWIRRDPAGKPTGVVDIDGVATVARSIPKAPESMYEAGNMALMRDMNKAGLTTVGGPCPAEDRPLYRVWASQGRTTVRFFCLVSIATGNTATTVDAALPKIAPLRAQLFNGNLFFDYFTYGEGFYGPASDNMVAPKGTQKFEDFVQWGRVAREVAKAGMPANIHSTLEGTIDGFLTQIEQVNKEYPIRNLRWSLIHLDQLTVPQIDRMKKLGMYAAVNPRSTIMAGIFNRVHGERSYSANPFRTVQESGIMWGLGTDAFEVNQYRPFTTLSYVVTGKAVGGYVGSKETISREDALIAHTRNNAFFVFQEDNLGSIAQGKLADLVVLDRDYLTVPADQIKEIRPVMTIVGGKIVYDASAPTAATQ